MRTKKCSGCLLKLPVTEFPKRAAAKDGLAARCRPCKAVQQSNWYQANKERHGINVRRDMKALRKRNKEYVNHTKQGKPCADCKQTFEPFAMDYDHLDSTTKLDTVARIAMQGHSIERIQKEINKCELVCAVCHRYRTHKRLQQNTRA